ncbi:AdoMet-dependent tRNA methyltransferase complex subunit [Penicillium sp. DV-2018c]|nr:AdoMet-dependent tRNA methyltransferase complex subunit [Penicillium sp. DV-2018c]
MKVLTANFVTCAVKECKTSPASFPLHFHDAELEQEELEFQPEFIRNILPRIDWPALCTTANEMRETIGKRNRGNKKKRDKLTRENQLGFPTLPESKPEGDSLNDEQTLKDLHRLLLETHVTEGKLACGNCGHQYSIKEGIANFLLPSHLGK